MVYKQEVSYAVELKANTEREAYSLICINELLHNLGLINENDYAAAYAQLTDNDFYKLF